MTSIKRVDSKDVMTCFLCEGLFTDPVSAPCGHHFCRTCISQHWEESTPYRCPKCGTVFSSRPELRANPTLSEKISQMRLCEKHQQPLESFCRSDQSLLCKDCVSIHQNHHIVSLKEESELRRSSLLKTTAQMNNMVKQRQEKEHEIRRVLEISQNSAEREKVIGLQGFDDMIRSLMKKKEQFLEELREKEKQTQKEAEDLIQEIHQEISELETRSTEVKQLSRSEDHLRFIQRSTVPDLKNWSTVPFEPQTFEGSATKALTDTEKKLTEEMSVLKSKLIQLKDLRKFAVDIFLDTDSAHSKLVLSKDLKQVYWDGVGKDFQDSPQRFTGWFCVLGNPFLSSGRSYFEVQVKEKTEWAIGVALESVDRKSMFDLSPESGVWLIGLWKNQLFAHLDPQVHLYPKRPPQKVGVFLDYEAGLVSFYDADSEDLIYSFTGCKFKQKIFPILDPGVSDDGENFNPLILTEVKK